jgi:hypothetical protein
MTKCVFILLFWICPSNSFLTRERRAPNACSNDD